MEVPGQKVTKDKNAKLCSLCEDYDITSNADGFCLECEVNICNSCFVKHKGRKSNRNHSLVSEQLTEFYEQFVSDVEAFTNHVIERINEMKTKVLNQAKDIMLNDKRKMEDLQKDIDDLIAELTRQNIELESKSDTPNNLFVATLLMKPELKKIKQNCDSFRHKNIVSQYKFMQDKILAQSITENKVIGMLIEQSFERSEHHQEEFKQAYSADEGQVQDPLPQQSESKQIEKEVTDTCTREHTMEAIAHQKRQPLLDRKFVCTNLNIDGECVSYAAYRRNGTGLYVFKENVRVGLFFEIEILSMDKSGSLAIGLVPDYYPDHLLPGVGDNSYGYHSDGDVRKNGSLCDINDRQSWQVGDKIRCTLSYMGWVQFENNGKVAGSSFLDKIMNCHFAVGMTSPGDRIKVVAIPAK